MVPHRWNRKGLARRLFIHGQKGATMTRSKRWAFVGITILGLSAVLVLPQSEVGPQVSVSNFPSTYEIKGTVSVRGPISHSQFIKREGVVVTTSHRTEMAELISEGTLDAEGFTSVTLSLQGEVKASSPANGMVGVMLVPDEEPVIRALREGKRVEFPIEASCQLYKGASPFFDSGSVTERLGFAKYRIYLYNTTPHGVETNVYIHLNN